MKKQGNELTIRNSASLAAAAWSRLEAAAQETLNGSAPALQLYADTGGITCLLRDGHGTAVTVQAGKISVSVEPSVE
jgi:hypothetical protein